MVHIPYSHSVYLPVRGRKGGSREIKWREEEEEEEESRIREIWE